jgi:hypothetical protein
MTTLSIDTPETQEAIERWRQGKINIFDEMARLERERDEAVQRRMETVLQCELYEQERDEARAALADVEEYGTEEINAAVELRQRLATALVERDEAREALKIKQ